MSDFFEMERRAQRCIAQGALTNSKRPSVFIRGITPTHVKSGTGCWLIDHNGKKYLDFVTGLCTNILGYGHDQVVSAVAASLKDGQSLSLSTHHEIEAAEKVKEMFPYVDAVKFLKTGSEACSAAIKIARAFHGVEYGSENLQKMWLREISRLFPQTSINVQDLREGISFTTTCDGDKALGAKEICEYSTRESSGEATFAKETKEDIGAWEEYCLLSGKASLEGWNYRQKFVRNMWKSECASSSQGLQSAVTRNVAMSSTSRRGARWLILSDGYHGHHDSFTSLMTPGCGVPTNMGILPLSGNEDLIEIAAAVIIEPVITDISPARIKWLQTLRDECTKQGVLLIFDEVITGFRFPKFSVSGYTGIIPDLVIMGKAMANGFPLAAVGGKYDVMNGTEYFVSSTYAGEISALVAAKTTMTLLQTKFDMDWLWKQGKQFLDEFNGLFPEKIRIDGYPTRGVFVGDNLTKALFWQEACLAGILFGPSWTFNFPLAHEWKNAFGAIKSIIARIKNGEVQMKGEMPSSPFAQRMRER